MKFISKTEVLRWWGERNGVTLMTKGSPSTDFSSSRFLFRDDVGTVVQLGTVREPSYSGIW